MFPSRQRPRSPGLESCLWLCLGGQRPHLSHLYRCWHHTWGGLGPGWWSPKGLRLLPTLPDPQTPPPHSNTFTTPHPHLGLFPSPSPLCLCFICPSCLRANVISPGEPSPTPLPNRMPWWFCISSFLALIKLQLHSHSCGSPCLPPELCEGETESLLFAAVSPAPPRTRHVRGSHCSLGVTALLFGGNATPDMCVGSWQCAHFWTLVQTRAREKLL